jgi:hypothetical protein
MYHLQQSEYKYNKQITVKTTILYNNLHFDDIIYPDIHNNTFKETLKLLDEYEKNNKSKNDNDSLEIVFSELVN